MGFRAMVLGATGLVGGFVVKELLDREEYDEVKVLVRRPLDIEHPKLTQIILNWEELDQYGDAFVNVRDVFCCLGTTMKKAGTQASFRQVDFEYPLLAARLAQQAGVRQFLSVSSMGADPASRIFYSRTKGELEEALTKLRLSSVHLFRPSLILGVRGEKRFGEMAGAWFMTSFDFLFRGKGLKYRAIPAETVAHAMVNIAVVGTLGVHIYPNDVIHVLGLVQ
ncbi:MAG TPA: oxidoreductase [Paenibacillus sp.]|jgi:uncharacterized protein YbjT (DUF2867 family)